MCVSVRVTSTKNYLLKFITNLLIYGMSTRKPSLKVTVTTLATFSLVAVNFDLYLDLLI